MVSQGDPPSGSTEIHELNQNQALRGALGILNWGAALIDFERNMRSDRATNISILLDATNSSPDTFPVTMNL
jgi:hypothetical protein